MAIDPNSPAVVATLPTELEAYMVLNYLTAQGIQAHLGGSASPGGWIQDRLDMQVVVRQADLARAKELLEQIGDPPPPGSGDAD